MKFLCWWFSVSIWPRSACSLLIKIGVYSWAYNSNLSKFSEYFLRSSYVFVILSWADCSSLSKPDTCVCTCSKPSLSIVFYVSDGPKAFRLKSRTSHRLFSPATYFSTRVLTWTANFSRARTSSFAWICNLSQASFLWTAQSYCWWALEQYQARLQTPHFIVTFGF